MIFESELFYTSFISLLLLLSVWCLLRFQQKESFAHALGLFLPLAILCLTRSMYHLVWLLVITLLVLYYYRGKKGFTPLLASSLFSLLLVSGWYLKNKIIFGSFSASSWIGMNMARNVFHDHELPDSTHIEGIEPFSRISAYKPFISGDYEKKYAGLNDRDLLREMKNDSFINMNHIDYIEVSKKYMDVSKDYIRAHPSAYLKNVLQSTIIFFTPATRYPFAEKQARKIAYYDLLYSFNLSEFAEGKQQRRVALTVSSIPKMLIYIAVFFFLLRSVIRERKISLLNGVVIATIGYVFVLSSLLEHYENMRFRYEIEPLFLLLLGQVAAMIIAGGKKSNDFNIH
jgi:4-amino-4-deoxy-L-arabinose transferase-like glycosyltransferase